MTYLRRAYLRHLERRRYRREWTTVAAAIRAARGT